MDLKVTIGGWVVGFLVGITGMGGGLIMTPLMIFVFGVSPSIAVGTDLVYSSITKLFGAMQHWRQQTIRFSIVKLLALGSVPGALLGVSILDALRRVFSANDFQHIISDGLGITYLGLTGWMVWNMVRKRNAENDVSIRAAYARDPGRQKRHTVLLGFVGGMLVGLTSVGSGTVFMAALLVMYPLPAAQLVGTDILQAVIVTGTAGLAHAAIGNVNIHMVLQLLLGSIPGILMGSRISKKIPDAAIRFCILMLLMGTSMQMLGVL
ncbi:sulfite exporter TauE/SafE family protein [Fodinisporobacter ferrooxydans]|uniref:Probable membrane transporter protein n=1 Tax=Fodinisporobacter ferrooxydans TaxID=2901836 RepID=A0ABY4CQT6_9BACL|nr:sulfite exporter TauE/SafE family protein [Alicyclobacillaceae bacterium MYW30-H2]